MNYLVWLDDKKIIKTDKPELFRQVQKDLFEEYCRQHPKRQAIKEEDLNNKELQEAIYNLVQVNQKNRSYLERMKSTQKFDPTQNTTIGNSHASNYINYDIRNEMQIADDKTLHQFLSKLENHSQRGSIEDLPSPPKNKKNLVDPKIEEILN